MSASYLDWAVDAYIHADEARAELAKLLEREIEHQKLLGAIREVTDRWCLTTDDYITELRRIYSEYRRLRDADVARQRAALWAGTRKDPT